MGVMAGPTTMTSTKYWKRAASNHWRWNIWFRKEGQKQSTWLADLKLSFALRRERSRSKRNQSRGIRREATFIYLIIIYISFFLSFFFFLSGQGKEISYRERKEKYNIGGHWRRQRNESKINSKMNKLFSGGFFFFSREGFNSIQFNSFQFNWFRLSSSGFILQLIWSSLWPLDHPPDLVRNRQIPWHISPWTKSAKLLLRNRRSCSCLPVLCTWVWTEPPPVHVQSQTSLIPPNKRPPTTSNLSTDDTQAINK